ncbi:MAG: glycosyltransferase family 39 protein [Candidatus Levybacteria bacterium]|nr:glycosyltransferase family 39 protein [Candidatus Levybacteria bacterium]
MQKFLRNKTNLFLILILTLAATLRLYGLDWDQGFHLHPDERAIVMFTTPLQLPETIAEFFSPTSPWNPHFFAYGSFPLYLLKIVGGALSIVNPLYGVYNQINLVGRFLSVFFDLGTLFIIFLLGRKLFNVRVGLLGTLFYSMSVLSIQLSHFYAVDTPLTFFILLTLYALVRFYERPTKIRAVVVGIFFGLSLATKISASVLVVAIGMTIAIDFLLLFLKNPHRPHIWLSHLPIFAKRLILDGVLIVIATITTFAIVEPYAFIDFKTFWLHNMQQRQMIYDPFTFPYTLQYVGKIPYFYELKNIFLWGQGPALATLSFFGVIYLTYTAMKQLNNKTIIVLAFFWAYFLMVGNFAIGFMRYMLPLYPLLSLFAAAFFFRITKSILPRSKLSLFFIFHFYFFIFILIWPLSFINIYTKPNTRVLASDWINQNIERGKTLAIEHWDDGLPLFGQEKYQRLTLPLYDPDTELKWTMINQKLAQTDYLILASNRLYVPLQKLTNCEKLPLGRCYKKSAEYYQKLFNGSLGFKKIAEFSVYSQLPFTNSQLPDGIADESFTVYDHPKVMIFKRND